MRFFDLRWILKHGGWACNVCGAAQFKPKTLEEIKVQKQREAREDLASAMVATRLRSMVEEHTAAGIACWGRANNRNWNSTEFRGVTEAVEQFLRSWEHHEYL